MAKLSMEMDVDNFIKALAIQSEIDGMNAENKMREMNNDSMAYWSSDFDNKAEELRALLVDEKPEKPEIKNREKHEPILLCDCHGVEGVHEIGSQCCIKMIADPQPHLVSISKAGGKKKSLMDMFSIHDKRYSRKELFGQGYELRKIEDKKVWVCLKKWVIKE